MPWGANWVRKHFEKEKRKSSNFCPEGWVGKAIGEGINVLGRRRNMCKGPEVAPPAVTLCLSSPLRCLDPVDEFDFPSSSQPMRVETGTGSCPLFLVQQLMHTRVPILFLHEGKERNWHKKWACNRPKNISVLSVALLGFLCRRGPSSWKKDQGTNLTTAVAQYSKYYSKTITCSCQKMAVKGLAWGRDWGLSSSTAKLSFSPSLDGAASSIPLLTLGDAQGLKQAESAISSLITTYLQMSEELVMERPIGTLNLPSSWVLQMDVHHGRPFRNPGFWLENMVATYPPSRKAN